VRNTTRSNPKYVTPTGQRQNDFASGTSPTGHTVQTMRISFLPIISAFKSCIFYQVDYLEQSLFIHIM